MSHGDEYLTARQKRALAAKRQRQRQQEREQAHLDKLDRMIGRWMQETSTVITDKQLTPTEKKD